MLAQQSQSQPQRHYVPQTQLFSTDTSQYKVFKILDMDGQNFIDSGLTKRDITKAEALTDDKDQKLPPIFVGYDLFEDENYLNANELQMLEWDPCKMVIICPDPFLKA